MIVTDAGRGAVDAVAFCARRGCRAGWRKACERSTASGREMLQRTAKSCGPDASTPASSLRDGRSARPGADKPHIPQATVTRKPDHRGELEISR